MTQFDADVASYKIISILGECFEGKAVVNLAIHPRTNKMVAIKRFLMDKIREDSFLVEQEIIVTKQLKHPNIIRYCTTFVHGPEVYVISPLMAYGSCKSLINAHFNEGLPELAIILILKDVLEAVSYIHKRGFIHRAIRASHILISANGNACLTGFRYSCPLISNGKWHKSIYSFPSTTQRNLNWLSPELLEQNLQGYNEKSDIYSVGMVCCELANGTEPFLDVAKTLMLIEKVRGWAPQILECNSLSENPNENDCAGDCEFTNSAQRRFTEDFHEFCALCLQREAYIRPTADELLSHPIFKVAKKGISLPELIRPAIPLSDKVAYNTDDVANFDFAQNFADMEIQSCEWEF